MRHHYQLTKLGRNRNQRQALFKQLAVALITHERLTTTAAKAKVLKGLIDKLGRIARKNTLASRRQLIALLGQKPAAHKLMDEISKRSQDRAGCLTRSVRLGERRGDKAMLVRVEFIDKPQPKEVKK